jgi:L-asparaginase II
MNNETNKHTNPEHVDPTVPAPLVEVRRGAIIESRHRGHIVAVTNADEIVARLGAPETVTYLRSSAKPHQVIPLITSGAADRFGFTPEEIAVACGSHSGEAVHVSAVKRMLEKIGLESSALKCGIHEPFSREVARELRRDGRAPDILQNNCSGKHTGMLALALHLGAPVAGYDEPESPVQQLILRTVAEFAGTAPDEIAVGVDGCGVPVFGMSLRRMALMYARLVAVPPGFDNRTRAACERIVAAMLAHPEMVGGTSERLDTELMRAGASALISKVGAEGVYTVGVLPSPAYTQGFGLALKVEDGEDKRARPTVVIDALRQLGVLNAEALNNLDKYSRFTVRNHRGDAVGSVVPNFNLMRAK